MDRCPAREARTRPLVLVVQRHDDTRELYAIALSAMGFDVASARDGAQAYRRACEMRPDIVVTDLPMPESDGWQFLQDLVLGSVLSIDIGLTNEFAGGDADLLVLNLLDPATNFTLVDTNLDQLAGPVPFQDALFVHNFATSQFVTASVSTPLLAIATVSEPGNWMLVMIGGALLLCGRTLRWIDA